MRIFRLNAAQHGALISIVGAYMRLLRLEPQEFVDCSSEADQITNTGELLNLLLNMGVESKASESKAGVTTIRSLGDLQTLAKDIFTEGPARELAYDFIQTAHAAGKVDAMRELEEARKLENMVLPTNTPQ